MPLFNVLNTNFGSSVTYQQYLADQLMRTENSMLMDAPPGSLGHVHMVRGNPTIGFGFDLRAYSTDLDLTVSLLNSHIQDAGRRISETQQSMLADYLSREPVILPLSDELEGLDIALSPNDIMVILGNVSLTREEAEQLLKDIVLQYENRLDQQIAYGLPQSVERSVLVELVYQYWTLPSMLVSALHGNSFEQHAIAWATIRYGIARGFENRRRDQSDRFGMYSAPESMVSRDEFAATASFLFHAGRDSSVVPGGISSNSRFRLDYSQQLGVATVNVAMSLGLDDTSFDWVEYVRENATLSEITGRNDSSDLVYGTDAVNVIDSGAGDDYVFGGEGGDQISGGDGRDVLVGGHGNDTLRGGKGFDVIYGDGAFATDGSGSDTLLGGAGSDVLIGGSGDDHLYGGEIDSTPADDISSNNYLLGGTGDDSYYYNTGDGVVHIYDSDSSGQIFINGQQITELHAQSEDGQFQIYTTEANGGGYRVIWNSVARVLAIHTDDGGVVFIHGDSSTLPPDIQRYISSGTVAAESHTATMTTAEPVSDVSVATATPDVGLGITVQEAEEFQAEFEFNLSDLQNWQSTIGYNNFQSNSYTITTWLGEEQAQPGRWVVYAYSWYNVVNNLPHETNLQGDFNLPTHIVNDSGFASWIAGGNGESWLEGGEWSDELYGELGNDRLFGNDGADWLSGAYTVQYNRLDVADNDYLDGGDGDDVLIGDENQWFIADATFSHLTYLFDAGNANHDDVLIGGAGRDFIYGNYGRDSIDGGEGDDLIYGGAQSDHILGGDGDDDILADVDNVVYGDGPMGYNAVNHAINIASHAGDDYVDAGAGNDTVVGGSGSDTILGGVGDDNLWGDGYVRDELTEEDIFAGEELPTLQFDDSVQQAGNDYIDGGAGDDGIVGGGGSDLLLGGDGNDTMFGGHNPLADVQQQWNSEADRTQDGADEMHGGNGQDYMRGGAGNDLMYGDADTDNLYGDEGNDTIYGGDGIDGLWGGDGDDQLFGGQGYDTLFGDAGDDVLSGGAGGDALRGGSGNDTYVYGLGDGVDLISDAEGSNRLLMTGISSSTVTVHVLDGNVQLAFADGQAVQLDAATFYAMGEIQFADGSFSAADVLALADPGTVEDPTIELDPSIDLDDITLSVVGDDLHITYTGDNAEWIDPTTLMGRRILSYLQGAGGASQQAILSSGQGGSVLVLTNFLNAANPAQYVTELSNGTQSIDLLAAYNLPRTQNGSAYSDSLVGGDVVDTILAGEGDDHVQAGAGDDVLAGQEGDDLLDGGSGNDTYQFRLGDGQDIVIDADGSDTIQFGEGILVNALEISEINGGLEIIVRRDANGQVLDRVFIAGWINQPNNGIERLVFADGSSLDAAQISAAITGNHAPTIGDLSDQSISVGENFSFSLPSSLFDDADVGDSLTIIARLSDGTVLPDWLQFDTQTLSFSGVFEPTSLSSLCITVYAIDSNGTFRSGTFNIVPAGVMLGDQQANAITGDDAANLISGLAGADTLVGAGGNDLIDGGQDNDYLSGQAGDDTLIGGGGDDTLVGGAGTNIIRIRSGDGSDVVLLSADGVQVVELAEGVQLSSITAEFVSNGDLQIRYGSDPNDCITIRDAADYLAGRGNQAIDLATALQLRIGLTAVMNGLDLVALANAASSDADTYFGDDASNTFDAGDGDDYINGQGGNDQLLGQSGVDQIVGGDGSDLIWSHAGNDSIWGDGTNYYDTQSPGNDVIDAGDGDDAVYGGLGADTLLGGDGNDTLMGGMTTSGGDSSGNDELSGGNGDDHLHGGDGDDRLIGGAGNDWLDGGTGRDTYVFGIGAGHDVIGTVDFAYGPQDILEFGAGVEPDDLRLVRTGNSLLIEIISSGDSLVITDWFSSIAYQFDEFRFANSERWNTETIAGHIWQSGDDTNNTFNGTYTDENYSALNGDDNISGNGGDDRLYGDAGNDRIDGGSGNDLLNGGLGNDVILGGDGADVIAGGAGDDELTGGGGGGLSGVDVYLFNVGDGHDRIISYQNGAFSQFEELHFGAGIGASDVSLSRQVNPITGTDDLVFTLNATGETVSLSGFFYNPAFIGITAVRFADGVTWDYQTLLSNAFGMEVVADNLVGTDADETMGGGAGNDQLTLLGGNDVAIGGNGDDSIDGGDGYDSLYGGNGDDYIFGGSEDDTISGDAGDDILEGGLGQDWYQFRAGDGNDVIRVTEDGASAGDVILLDRLYRSNARIYRNGNDLVIETIGSPDRVTVSGLFALSNPVNALSAVYFLDQSLSMDQIMSVLNSPTAGDDWLVGQDEEADTINALAGNDTVLGLGGADSLNGGTGDDALYGGEGNDRLYGDSTSSISTLSGNDTLYGEGGNDFIYAGYGTDTAFGGDGDDTIYGAYTTSDTAVSGVDTLHGGAGDDKIYGNDGGDSLYGDAGIDTIVGGSGSDVIRGGDDGDFLYGDSTNTASTVAGTDTIFGDGGNDVIAGGYGNDSIDGGSGDDTLYGAYTTSDAAVSGVDTMRGGDGNDAIYGNDGNDLLFGDTGNDVIKGGSGSDQITGGTGSDTITAGTGNDTVFFGRGDGQDVVSFYDTATTRTDLLQLATGISTSDVVLSRGGVGNNDLIVQVVGTTDTVTITGYFAATANQLTGIRFTDGGVTWNRTQIQSLVDASASGQVTTGGSSGSQITEGSRLMTTKFLANDLLQLTQAMASFGAESDSALMSAREQHAEPNWLTVSAVHRPESRAVL